MHHLPFYLNCGASPPESRKIREAQADTHGIVHQALEEACNRRRVTFRCVYPNRPKQISYYGYHLIEFEKTTPDDGKVWVDGRRVSREELIRFLRFEETTERYRTTVLPQIRGE